MTASEFMNKALHPWQRHPREVVPAPTDEERLARRRRKMDNVIVFCWGLIVAKSVFVIWAVHRYQIPFSPLWVVVPTILFATLATGVYYYLRD
jgi:hypothetical protein